MEWRNVDTSILCLRELLCFMGFLFASAGVSAIDHWDCVSPRDTLEVDGARVAYAAFVEVDTMTVVSMDPHVDWWFGVGLDLSWPSTFGEGELSLISMGTTRPAFRVERRHAGKQGRWGIHCTYHQPWMLSEEGISRDIKGWILDNQGGLSAPSDLRQVVLTPDSLAFERDTLMAPISAGHALRVGGSWERVSATKWHLWLAASISVIRPTAWLLSSPSDPTSWRGVVAEDTYAKASWLGGRCRLELGGISDIGKSHPGRRSASQLRVSMFVESLQSWGGRVILMVSPTRR